ncbi:polysaccharide biosynthesis/export family protein [Pyruvatibacter mobilis]|uniref:polysaccharide biosynthesis/export family protein n=1 Tax=Pyruvatibacter mobilis TaxID=1712261 RepID=UPI003C7D6C34
MTSVSRANSSSVLQPALGLLVLAFSLVVLIGGAVAQTADRLSRDIEYQLDAGDRVRVIVFNEPDLSGEFEVDGTGVVSLPLIGKVSARGLTARDFEDAIATALLDGYLKDPRVSIEVLNFRPFYIIGEVENGGEYDYVPDMTVLNAVALAGGYTYRADDRRVYITQAGANSEVEVRLDEGAGIQVLPGDIIRVPERFF